RPLSLRGQQQTRGKLGLLRARTLRFVSHRALCRVRTSAAIRFAIASRAAPTRPGTFRGDADLGGRGSRPATVNTYGAAVRSFLGFAHRAGFTRFNAGPLIKLKKAPRQIAALERGRGGRAH